ncbi:ABC transporter ATP-binding protein [Staphylococcus felis]|uniref:ABC transporter ATP-binding protein n=1 Tax=Staphylococcus felis TaxID=46127 RepID=UPI000CCFDC6C|nr:ABC transporter ATP-binding protein [Staphylococcus felis]AVP36752.1 ABC transporter ATP-binding protein [Staphylococcus felis]PNZ34640.1 ABC transporter ATP-binding protein [Staphylococcus felis]QQB03289.1 ABC transporter ATP-binding protein [Staphylococcus felis]REH75234.1 ABC transporter ATP-binding protein [Staphylococcus felis]REI12122.1 ABC transporter ATP-binding protein [Staphylococcus felis]
MESKSIANLSHTVKVYDKRTVLNDVSLSVNSGEILGIIGPSGSGKTTLIKCLLGMENLNSGLATILDTTMPNRKILGRIGYMGQSDALYENLSAYENLMFFGNLIGLKGKQLEKMIDENLQLVKLSDFKKKLVNTFSGGMKRRLSLAITLLGHPELIILDEPTVGIDPSLRKDIWEQLKILSQQGKGVIVTTHMMDEAEKCDLVGLIIDGKLFEIGTPETLKEKFNVTSIEEVFLKAEVRDDA